MLQTHFKKASILTMILVIIFIIGWEYYWRNRGFLPSYNDDKVLWTTQRKKINQAKEPMTVFIGGSRIKFDLDVPTWESLTGEKAIQLAIVGTPSRLILRDLANDVNFKGKLIIDVAENQFFTVDTIRRDKSAREAIEYYHKETPAQKAGASIDYLIESKLVFLEEGKFGLNQLLSILPISNRPGVIVATPFPREFSLTNFNRQNKLTPMFLADTSLQKRQIAIWSKTGISLMYKTPGIKGDTLEGFLKGIKASIDKIKSRGGMVLFVRPPSNFGYTAAENKVYPRQQYWDRLLAYTNTDGIHFSDYPSIANFVCPEWSHLSPKDAVTFTTELVKILREDKGWTFNAKNSLVSHN